MKAALPIIGVLMCLVGVIWIGQGLNFIPGSFMTGVPFWAVAGVVLLIAGIAAIVTGVRSRRTPTA